MSNRSQINQRAGRELAPRTLLNFKRPTPTATVAIIGNFPLASFARVLSSSYAPACWPHFFIEISFSMCSLQTMAFLYFCGPVVSIAMLLVQQSVYRLNLLMPFDA